MHGQTDPRKYLLIAGILQIVWGFDPAASKYVIDEIPVELYIALRWTISGVIFALFLAATGQWRRVATRQWRVRTGQVLLSRIDARNGAIGLVPFELDDAIVTNDFWAFERDVQLSL